MEAVIFCGIQASGKTSYYKEHFFKTHIRISLDMLNTRNKENRFLETCFNTWQRFVIDNTNPTRVERERYIEKARLAKFKVIGYYFESTPLESISRNKERQKKEFVPEKGIWATYKKMEPPSFEEGFDQLFLVRLNAGVFTSIEIIKFG
ncbi:AAA family ATPase [Pedobacter sp. SYSU D00535]|uniref:AAA family ATPase n=1 Tax=Pedobacter sp. SYSU D00535 TaxID=2810308 RepID=UPI001A9766EE|nr:AAA family ATPase [Pedobacter sp. SYSU D00535]